MKYKPILNLCLLSVFLLMVPVSCDDWTEMEIHDSEIKGTESGAICRLYPEAAGV